MSKADKAALKLNAIVKRDYERICAVTLPGPNARGYYFPHEIWLEHIRMLADRCKTPLARTRLTALWYAVFRLP